MTPQRRINFPSKKGVLLGKSFDNYSDYRFKETFCLPRLPMLKIKEKHHRACSNERNPLLVITIYWMEEKKAYYILQKPCGIKWVKLLPRFCNKFVKICRAKFKLQSLIKIPLYTATFLQDLFRNFSLIKHNMAKILQ